VMLHAQTIFRCVSAWTRQQKRTACARLHLQRQLFTTVRRHRPIRCQWSVVCGVEEELRARKALTRPVTFRGSKRALPRRQVRSRHHHTLPVSARCQWIRPTVD
jgi:hypothetical protein